MDAGPPAAGFAPVSAAEWRARVAQELGGEEALDQLSTPLLDGLDLRPVYGPEDAPQDSDSLPGSAPFQRGSRAQGPGGDQWLARARCDHPDPFRAGELLAEALDGGAQAAWVELDCAARLGLDADDEAAGNAVGVTGVTAHHRVALARVLQHIDPREQPLALDAGGNALPASACLLAVLQDRSIAWSECRLSLCADPLGALARDGALPQSRQAAEKELGLLALWCAEYLPLSRSVLVSTTPYRDAGATPPQELGFALATLAHYLRVLERAGMAPAQAAAQIDLRTDIGRDVFGEISKLRALRVLWSKLFSGCGVAEPAAPTIHACSSRTTLAERDPWVNMLRVTTHVFAAACGGADSITAASFDEMLGQPGLIGRKAALNTQNILREESHLGAVLDPAGGSYFIERHTQDLARAGWRVFQEIERSGGMAQALESGHVQRLVDASWEQRAARLARRQEAVIGVSAFPIMHGLPPELDDWDAEALLATAAAELTKHKQERGSPAPPGGDVQDFMDALVHGAKQGLTLGEMSRILPREEESARLEQNLPLRREAAPFEELRERADSIAATSDRPAVYLANLGRLAEHKARATFAEQLFHAGGFAVIQGEGTEGAANSDAGRLLATRFSMRPTLIVCICGSDESYSAAAPEVARRMKQIGVAKVLMAGRPGKNEEELREAGVDGFVHQGQDVCALLDKLLTGDKSCEEVQA